tara:strand:- start:2579 stop:2866 length:288 start_codon:yes stop_codon:yes gene_type:complete
MKITKSQLKQLIKEEIQNTGLVEFEPGPHGPRAVGDWKEKSFRYENGWVTLVIASGRVQLVLLNEEGTHLQTQIFPAGDRGIVELYKFMLKMLQQ